MRIRYRECYPEFWTDAHALLARALKYGVAQAPTTLYPETVRETTVEREYLTAVLLGVAPTGNLLPTQTHCLHLILHRLNEHYRLADSYAVNLPFFIDPAEDKPPQRWLVCFKPRPGLRFFGFGGAYAQVDAMRSTAHTGVAPPEWVQQSRIDAKCYRSLLDMLMEHWSEHPPQRRKRRDRQVATILVTPGFDQVYRMLLYSKFAKEGRQLTYAEITAHDNATLKAICFDSLNADTPMAAPRQPLTPLEVLNEFERAGDPELIERWSVVDTSEGGLGAVAERHHGWSRAGMLVGLRYHDSIDWRIATVRRLGRTSKGKLGVGLKCLPETAGCVILRLRLTDSERDLDFTHGISSRNDANADSVWTMTGAGGGGYADAILVGGEQPMLIAALGTYAPDRVYEMLVGKCVQNIRFGQLMESGGDFECISFSPAGQVCCAGSDPAENGAHDTNNPHSAEISDQP